MGLESKKYVLYFPPFGHLPRLRVKGLTAVQRGPAAVICVTHNRHRAANERPSAQRPIEQPLPAAQLHRRRAGWVYLYFDTSSLNEDENEQKTADDKCGN